MSFVVEKLAIKGITIPVVQESTLALAILKSTRVNLPTCDVLLGALCHFTVFPAAFTDFLLCLECSLPVVSTFVPLAIVLFLG